MPMEIIVETFRNPGEQSAQPIRVRPAAGQFDRDYRVWCSVAAREAKPLNGLFRVVVSWVHPNAREKYLRISPSNDWHAVTAAEAKRFIADRNSTSRSDGQS